MNFLKVIFKYSKVIKNNKLNFSEIIKQHFYFPKSFKKHLIFEKYKMLQHAQTQHGDNRTDNENIVVLPQNLLLTPIKNSSENLSDKNEEDDSTAQNNIVDHALQSKTTSTISETECVWIYKFDHEHESDDEQNCKPIENLIEITPEPEIKRKCNDDVANNSKKIKHDNKKSKSKQSELINERYDETSYYFENGLRKVYPYYFQFTTFTKGRWVGEKILDVFAREFRAQPAKEYERCIQAGTLSVNNEKVPTDYKLKHNDLLSNVVHRHEVPVTGQPITIVYMDNDILVVNKPASIPVHPCGRYRHNTVIFILAKEYNLKNLRTIHRLDRLTSGLLLFGRNSEKARLMTNQISKREVQKEYICRVEGEFPNDIIECTEPIEVVSFKIGVCKVSSKGKKCTTKFEKLSYDGKSSVVLCKPLTGRMHQIRVHLQYLGYPIVNDPLYNHEIFGPNKGRGGDYGGRTDSELIKDLINIHNAENWLGIDDESALSSFKKDIIESQNLQENVNKANELSCTKNSLECPTDTKNVIDDVTPTENPILTTKINVGTQTGFIAPDLIYNKDKLTVDEYCYECTVRYRDPRPEDLVMYLHAFKYKGIGWEYQTELPDWAAAEFHN